jgi:hypothetical protein
MNSRLFITGDVSMGSRLFVLNDSSFIGNMFVGGRSIKQGDVSMNSRLFINGDVSMNSRLFITGDVSMGSRLFINGDVSLNSRLFITGDVSMNKRLFVSGDTSLNSNFYAYGYSVFQGDVSMGTRLYVASDLILSGTSRIFVGGSQYQSGSGGGGGTTTTTSTFNFTSDLSTNASLYVSGSALIGFPQSSAAANTNASYVLNVNGNVQANLYNATSDQRIKTNITTVNGTFALDTLRKLEPKKYSYVDTDKPNDYTWGFLGQDLEKSIDYVVNKSTNYIPNIYEFAELSNNFLIKLTNKTTNDLIKESLLNKDLSKIRFLDNNKDELIRTIDKIIDIETFSITEPIYDYSFNKIFVYGQLVDDFYSVNHTSVFTITTAAVKEIDNQLQKALAAIDKLTKMVEDQNKVIEKQNEKIEELYRRMK